MHLERWIIGSGNVLAFRDPNDYQFAAGGGVLVAMAEARPALAWNCWVPGSLWTVLRGQARVVGRDVRATLAADDVFIAEHASRVSVQAVGGEATMLGVLLPPHLLAAADGLGGGDGGAELALLPDVRRHDPELAVALLQLAHGALRQGGEESAVPARVAALLQRLAERQASLAALAARCPGRSQRYRRQVLLRLVRARRYIELAAGSDMSLARLAAIATMSPTHFLRLYRGVFGETPHRHVVRCRLAAARELLVGSTLGVAEVCRTLGFENRCAFARVFKQHFGVSPSTMRELAGQSGRSPRTAHDAAWAVTGAGRAA